MHMLASQLSDFMCTTECVNEVLQETRPSGSDPNKSNSSFEQLQGSLHDAVCQGAAVLAPTSGSM